MTPACCFNEEQVAELLGITVEEIGFALRRGDLRNHDATTIHGARLWTVGSVLATPLVQARFPEIGQYPELLNAYVNAIRQAFGQAPVGEDPQQPGEGVKSCWA